MVNNGSMTVSLRRGLLAKEQLNPRKRKEQKVTLRESGIISINYPEPFPVGEVSKKNRKELGLIRSARFVS